MRSNNRSLYDTIQKLENASTGTIRHFDYNDKLTIKPVPSTCKCVNSTRIDSITKTINVGSASLFPFELNENEKIIEFKAYIITEAEGRRFICSEDIIINKEIVTYDRESTQISYKSGRCLVSSTTLRGDFKGNVLSMQINDSSWIDINMHGTSGDIKSAQIKVYAYIEQSK